MTKAVKVEGKHVRWFAAGAVAEHLKHVSNGTAMLGADFDYLVSDTCNRIHKYLTTHGAQGPDGSASDMQCVACIEAAKAFLPEGLTTLNTRSIEVTIYW